MDQKNCKVSRSYIHFCLMDIIEPDSVLFYKEGTEYWVRVEWINPCGPGRIMSKQRIYSYNDASIIIALRKSYLSIIKSKDRQILKNIYPAEISSESEGRLISHTHVLGKYLLSLPDRKIDSFNLKTEG